MLSSAKCSHQVNFLHLSRRNVGESPFFNCVVPYIRVPCQALGVFYAVHGIESAAVEQVVVVAGSGELLARKAMHHWVASTATRKTHQPHSTTTTHCTTSMHAAVYVGAAMPHYTALTHTNGEGIAASTASSSSISREIHAPLSLPFSLPLPLFPSLSVQKKQGKAQLKRLPGPKLRRGAKTPLRGGENGKI